MSNVFQPKRKELAKVELISSSDYDKSRKKYTYVGSVNRGFSSYITTKRNKITGKCSFIDDTSSLTKKTKNQIVNFFSDKNNRNKAVVYLVVDKKNKKEN